MHWGRLELFPVSVTEVLENGDLDGQLVAVHGRLYYGEGCKNDEFLVLPKDGLFDGDRPPMPESLDRCKSLFVGCPDGMRIGRPAGVGMAVA